MSFEDLIQDKLGKHKKEIVNSNIKITIYLYIQIEELILDNLFTTEKFTEEHKTAFEKYKALVHFSLNKIGLTSLENFPKLEKAQIVSIIIINHNLYRLN